MDRCTCQHGRDYDGSEFGPCEFCEAVADAERSDARQSFERYPELALWMERLANTPGVMSLGEWMAFCNVLNSALDLAAHETDRSYA